MSNLLGPLCAFGSSVTWSIGSSWYTRLTHRHSAFSVNFSRALIAFPMFVVAVFVTSGGWQPGLESIRELTPTHFGWFTLSMLTSYAVADAIFFKSSRLIGVPAALAIASSYPLWTAISGYLFQGDRLAPTQLAGLFLTVTGIVLVILSGGKEAGGGTQPQAATHRRNGVLLAFLTSFLWSLNSLAVARGGVGVSPFVGNSVRMALALLLCGGLGLSLTPNEPLLLPKKEILRSLWVFALEGFGGSAVFLYGLSHTPLAVGATLSALAPVLSVPVSWALGLEKFSPFRTLGICVVVVGVSLLVGAAAFL